MRKLYFILLSLIGYLGAAAQLALPIDFESASIPYTFTDFGGGVATVVNNPSPTGINTSLKVGKMVKGAGDPWGGSYLTLSAPIDFSTNRLFKMKVYAPKVGTKVLLKVENESNPGINAERNAVTTTANTWEDLSFDFSSIITSNQYSKVVLIFELGTVGDGSANFTYYFDDIRLTASGGGALSAPTLPLDFESNTVNWSFTNFDGGVTTRIDNPQPTGINTSSKVAQMVKNAGQPWGGSWIQLAGPIDFSTNKTFKLKVWSPRVGAKVLLKVENQADGGINFEREVAVTLANQWEDLTFDFSSINTANQYHKIVFIFDLGTMGDGSANFTFLFDDLRLVSSGGGGLTQMNLHVTFDDPTVQYGLIGFGGAENSTIVVDPTNASNMVAKVVKSATAELWAGTTITASSQLGFSSKIPFTASQTTMSVRVWSPDAGITVRLKVEDHSDPTKSVETNATTTVAGGWETLLFDFSNPAAGTAALNLAYNYDKASIFFNFGTTGATAGEKTYYFDNVTFGNAILPIGLVNFSAVRSNGATQLTWTTSFEQNNKGFSIERSHNGRTWSELTFVAGKGNSALPQSYKAEDSRPLNGANYYRLKQVDNDGRVSYSEVVSVNHGASAEFKVYPNPVRGQQLTISGNWTPAASFRILTAEGKLIQTGKLSASSKQHSVSLAGVPAGIYTVQVIDGAEHYEARIIKQ